MEYATSEWISFVDSDDWLNINTYASISSLLTRNIDIICFGTNVVATEGATIG